MNTPQQPASTLTSTSQINMEIVDVINDVESICVQALGAARSVEKINLAIAACDAMAKKLTRPSKVIMLVYLALIKSLDEAYVAQGKTSTDSGVYAIEYSDGRVKIGRTSNFQGRLGQLLTQGGLFATRSKFFPCGWAGRAESQAHSAFQSQRLGGEYFDITFDEACSCLNAIVEGRLINEGGTA